MESLKPAIPEKLEQRLIIQGAKCPLPRNKRSTWIEISRSYLEKHCDYHYVSFTGKWAVWVWLKVTFLNLTGRVTIEEANSLMNECWCVLVERKQRYPFIFSLVDITGFEVQTETFRTYLKENWDHLLDRQDLKIVFITGNGMKSAIWRSIFVMMGKWDRVRFFARQERAFQWLSKRLQAEVGV